MKLLQLLPDQVMKYWNTIKPCILQALPPYIFITDEVILHLQEKLLLGTLTCWVAIDALNASTIYGFCTTEFILDPVVESKNLLVYTVSVVNDHPESMWEYCAKILLKYAKANGCEKIIAYSNNEHMLKISERLGGNTYWHLIYFDVS